MRARAGVVVCAAIVLLAALSAYERRLHYPFPSMIDDWNAIASSPEQLGEVIRLGNPEDLRYRPGFVIWNALQWHTLGAPTDFLGPQLWGLARLLVLVLGVTLLAALLITRPESEFPRDPRWLLTLAVPLTVLTVPGMAVDITRFGPQEPLMVGCMTLGAVMLVRTLDRLLDGGRATTSVVAATILGLVCWAFGVIQKESSIMVLVLAPFLVPTVRAHATRWARLPGRRRAWIVVCGLVALLPFVPMVARFVQLATADERVYESIAAQRSLLTRLTDQLTRAEEMLLTPLFLLLASAAVILVVIAIVRHGVDWLVVGLLVTAFSFVAFSAASGVVASRYYLPVVTLFALAFGRAAASLGSPVAVVAAAALVAVGAWQAEKARETVQGWMLLESSQETVVREAAARAAGGCVVDVTGSNVELVQALPVLMPLTRERPRDCAPGARFVVVIDWIYGATPPEDPVLSACGPGAETVWSNQIGRVVRCET